MKSVKKFPAKTLFSFVTVVAACCTYLSLANDTKMWPYGGSSWLGLTIGVVLVGLGLWLVVSRERGPVQDPVKWTLAGLVLALAGSVVSTTAIVQIIPPEPRNYPIREDSPPSIVIESTKPGETITDPTRLFGRFETSLRGGETLWVFVGHGERVENRPASYQLLTGPCGKKDDDSGWACPDYPLVFVNESVRNVTYYFFAVDSTRSRELSEKLQEGARIDLLNNFCTKHGICSPERVKMTPEAATSSRTEKGTTT